MPWHRDERDYPWYDTETRTIVLGHRGDFRVEVIPMIFNDRVAVTHRPDYPHGLVAGFCYDQDGSAMIAASAWLACWDELDVPPGFKKEAFNTLPEHGKGTRS